MPKANMNSGEPRRRRAPAMTPDEREDQLIAMAVDLAEKQLLEGTASSQVITHFLQRGSARERLEKERLIEENKLLRAKTEAIEAEKKKSVAYDKVLEALRVYQGRSEDGGPNE